MRASHWAAWGPNPGVPPRLRPRSPASLPTQPTSARRRKRLCATPNRRARTSLRSNSPGGASGTHCNSPRQADSTEGANMATTQETPIVSPVGRDTPRVDGPRKVSGMAQYTSDFHFPGMLYAVPVEATIANGKVVKLDTAAAEKMPGVRAIFHRQNIGKMYRSVLEPGFESVCEERRPPFEDDLVRYYGQYIAVAVADTFETAKAAADAVRATYAKDKPNVENDLKAEDEPNVVATTFGPYARLESQRGDATGAFASAPVKLDQTYVTPAETHNPLELHATTAIWEGSTLTMYESSQGVVNQQGVLAQMFGLPKENVRDITKFVGSGFGSKLWPWAMSARRGRGAAVGQAGETRAQPQNDVPVGRSPRAHPAARAPWRHARWQTRLAPARLRLPPVDARSPPRRLRRGHAVPIQRAQPPRDFRTRQAERRST